MSEVNIFEQAVKKKVRFPSHAGELTLEQLYDLPLVHKSPMCLDAIAQGVSIELESLGKHSFVSVTPDPRRGDLELKLDLVKHVIADKIAAREAAERRAANAEKRRKLLDAYAAKDEEELRGKSKEELLKELEALED